MILVEIYIQDYSFGIFVFHTATVSRTICGMSAVESMRNVYHREVSRWRARRPGAATSFCAS